MNYKIILILFLFSVSSVLGFILFEENWGGYKLYILCTKHDQNSERKCNNIIDNKYDDWKSTQIKTWIERLQGQPDFYLNDFPNGKPIERTICFLDKDLKKMYEVKEALKENAGPLQKALGNNLTNSLISEYDDGIVTELPRPNVNSFLQFWDNQKISVLDVKLNEKKAILQSTIKGQKIFLCRDEQGCLFDRSTGLCWRNDEEKN